MLEDTDKLDFYQEMVTDLLFDGNDVAGVVTHRNQSVRKTVVLTNGTFLNGLIHIGEQNFGGGGIGERAMLA